MSLPAVRWAGFAMTNPTKHSNENYQSSKQTTEHLSKAILGTEELDLAKYDKERDQIIRALKDEKEKGYERRFNELLESIESPATKNAILRAKDSGRWKSACPDDSNQCIFTPEEFRDSAYMSLALEPLNLNPICDGCTKKNDSNHALNCKKGGLVIQRHDYITKEVTHWLIQSVGAPNVSLEPMIHAAEKRRREVAQARDPTNTPVEDDEDSSKINNARGDILARGIHGSGRFTIYDTRVINMNSTTYCNSKPENVLKNAEKDKKRKHLKACLDQNKFFVPLIISCEGLLGREFDKAIKDIAQLFAKKHNCKYSRAVDMIKTRVSIANCRATSYTMRGSRITSKLMSRMVTPSDAACLEYFR